MKYILLISTIVLFTIATSIGQTNYYVSPTGSNANSGTEPNQAWQTINYAAQNSSIVGGDTVFIMQGVYDEQITFTISGAPDQKITFKNYHDEDVVLSGSSLPAHQYIMKIEDRDHLRITGLKFQDYQQLDAIGLIIINSSYIHIEDNEFMNIDYSATAIGETPTEDQNSQPIIAFGREPENADVSQDLVFLRNKIHDCETGWSEALSVNGHIEGFEIAYNEVYNNTNIGIVAIGYEGECPNPENDQARNGHIHHNIVHDNPSAYSECAGIYVDGAAQMNIENNVVYNNDYGIEIGCENNGNIPGATANNILVRSNIIYNNTYTGIALGGYNYPTTGYVEYAIISNNTLFNNDTENNYQGEMMITFTQFTMIESNIFYVNNADNVLFTYTNPANTVSFNFNLYFTISGDDNIIVEWNGNEFTTFDSYRSATSQDGNSNFKNPKLVDNSTGNPDLHIQATSPCVNAGNPSLVPEGVDMDDEPRINQGRVDIGADEFYLTTSIHNPTKSSDVLCFPNPTTGKVTVDTKGLEINYIAVVDLTGRIVFDSKNSHQTGNIDLSSLQNGIYIMSLYSENKVFTSRIVKK